MKPFVVINDDIKQIMLGLIEACGKIDLGNVSFEIYPRNAPQITFSLWIVKTEWQLIVGQDQRNESDRYVNCRDVYKISGIKFNYHYSESG